VLALALVMTIGAAGAALADTGQASSQRRVPAAQTGIPAADRTAAAEESPSPVVPLVFAGIVILAVASPTRPRYSRSGYYSRWERW
jgi:hypothetical protein